MNCSLGFVFLIAMANAGLAAGESKPNTLTSKELAEGMILLFDGETNFGWKIEGEATVSDGILTLGGRHETTATATTEFGYGAIGFDALTDDAKDARLTFNAYKGPFIRVIPPGETGWHQFHAQALPNDISVWASGSKGFGKPGTFSSHTPFALHVPAGQKILLRNIKFLPLPRGLHPIFNGQNLSDWKEFLGKKSEFSVTPEGWLNIKNGPGDLQTEGQYADFILQLECISNGEHLNSGVFFRCRPGEYQQGYEAQIRNQFTAEPTQEYTLEVFNEKTGELKEKKS